MIKIEARIYPQNLKQVLSLDCPQKYMWKLSNSALLSLLAKSNHTLQKQLVYKSS